MVTRPIKSLDVFGKLDVATDMKSTHFFIFSQNFRKLSNKEGSTWRE